MEIYSTYAYLLAEGEKEGRQHGFIQEACRQLGTLLRRHGKRAFGPLADEQQALLDRLVDGCDLTQLERLRDGFPGATAWADLLAAVTEPAPAPAPPEYLAAYEFNPTPVTPSIDQHVKVGYGSGESGIVHLRFQRLYQENLGAILYKESEELRKSHKLPVQTAVLVLWPGADGPGLTGTYRTPTGELYRYQLTRLWEKDVEEMLTGSGMALFAPLARVTPEQLPEVVRRMADLFAAEAKDEETLQNLWLLAYWSAGLRYTAAQVNEWFAAYLPLVFRSRDVQSVRADGYYASVVKGSAEGKLQATVGWVLALGSHRLGEPPPQIRKGLECNRHLDRLEQIAARVWKSPSWEAALALN